MRVDQLVAAADDHPAAGRAPPTSRTETGDRDRDSATAIFRACRSTREHLVVERAEVGAVAVDRPATRRCRRRVGISNSSLPSATRIAAEELVAAGDVGDAVRAPPAWRAPCPSVCSFQRSLPVARVERVEVPSYEPISTRSSDDDRRRLDFAAGLERPQPLAVRDVDGVHDAAEIADVDTARRRPPATTRRCRLPVAYFQRSLPVARSRASRSPFAAADVHDAVGDRRRRVDRPRRRRRSRAALSVAGGVLADDAGQPRRCRGTAASRRLARAPATAAAARAQRRRQQRRAPQDEQRASLSSAPRRIVPSLRSRCANSWLRLLRNSVPWAGTGVA